MSNLKKYIRVINEELLERFTHENHYIELYKNPTNIKNFPAWCRGVVTYPFYHLYLVVEYDEEMKEVPGHQVSVIHPDIIRFLADRGILSPELKDFDYNFDNPIDYIDTFLLVQRKDRLDRFVIGESYDSSEIKDKKIKETLKLYVRRMMANRYILDI